MSRSRRLASRSRQRRRRRRIGGGVASGSAAEVDLGLQDSGERVGDRGGREERAAGEHLVEDDAERPDVGALVDRAAARLLGRHVGRGAEDDAELRPLRGRHRRRVHERRRAREVGRGGAPRGRVHRLGEAEVEDLDLAVGRELDVGGLEVAVDDSLLVRRLERLGDLPRDGEGLVEGERPALQPLGEVFALDELHDEGADAARLLEAVDRGDVGVLQLGQDLRLALETGEAVGVGGERLGQDLDRDLALQLRVGRAVDDAHPALAERGGDLVGPRREPGERLISEAPPSSSGRASRGRPPGRPRGSRGRACRRRRRRTGSPGSAGDRGS